MICQDARDLFSARADAALSAAEQAELQAHLATCAECQREWTRFERTVELLHAIEPAHAPAGFVERVVAARPRPWYTRLARGLFVPWPVKLPLEAAAILLVAGLAIMIVQRSPELQQASRLNEAPPPVALPPEPAKEPLAGPPGTEPAPPSETLLSFRPEDAVRHKGRSVPESREDARDTGVGARSREQAQGAAELRPQNVAPGAPAERVKKTEASPAEARKETATSEMSGGKVGAATAPSAPAPARQPHLSASEQAVAKQATPERSAALGLSRASSGLQARLSVADRAAAESTVRDLVTRAGGRVDAEPGPASQADAGATILTVLVPADRWDELRRGLEAVGKLRVTGQKVEDAGQLLITLRLEH